MQTRSDGARNTSLVDIAAPSAKDKSMETHHRVLLSILFS